MTRSLKIMALALVLLASPAIAHKKHKHPEPTQTEAVQNGGAAPAGGPAAVGHGSMTAEHGTMGETMEMDEDRSSMSFGARLIDWLGRLHPIIVHFPIAFFPAALFTAIVGRRRPAFAAPVQFLVVAGGIIAPIAAVLGWLDAIGTDSSPLLTVHRWLGTAIGVSALALAVWAARAPERDRSTGMIVGLSVITVAIVVQGWFGGALVHGIDHLNW